ncbi:MAG: prevent-host-death protein antitoxin of TAS system, partial [Acidimicrobiales bacterium]
VTNHGEVAAVLVPPSLTSYERLVAAGKVQLSSRTPADLRRVRRAKSTRTSAEIVADVRAER